MPDVGAQDRKFKPSPFARRVAEQGGYTIPQGRPKADSEPREGVVTKTVKHLPSFWAAMDAEAKRFGLSLHEAMRQAVEAWLVAHKKPEPVARPKRM